MFVILFYLLLGILPYIVNGFILNWIPSNTQKLLLTALEAPIYWCLIFISFLGIRLRQGRILVTSIIYIVVYYICAHSASDHYFGLNRMELLQIISLSVPATCAVLFNLKEVRIWSIRYILKIMISAMSFIVLVAWCFIDKYSFHEVLDVITFIDISLFDILPDLSLAFCAVSAGLIMWQYDDKIQCYKTAVIFSFLPALYAINLAMKSSILDQAFDFIIIIAHGAICCILLHAILKIYWQRIYLDELTGVRNRRAFDEAMDSLEGLYSIAVIDIDHFKRFNDTYGHAEGDNVLRLVARVIMREFGERAYRFGGEEFCVIMTGLNCFEASESLEQLREEIESRQFYLRTSERKAKGFRSMMQSRYRYQEPRNTAQSVNVTVSIGIASPESPNARVDDVFKSADKALYKAKTNGRNQVMIDSHFLKQDMALTAETLI